jgi:hypothetical protein
MRLLLLWDRGGELGLIFINHIGEDKPVGKNLLITYVYWKEEDTQ